MPTQQSSSSIECIKEEENNYLKILLGNTLPVIGNVCHPVQMGIQQPFLI